MQKMDIKQVDQNVFIEKENHEVKNPWICFGQKP